MTEQTSSGFDPAQTDNQMDDKLRAIFVNAAGEQIARSKEKEIKRSARIRALIGADLAVGVADVITLYFKSRGR